jgi:accessory colonization factor AcfC
MESLLYFYPDIKNNIVVFDDDSNDGTKEWLENNNINRITWKYFDYEDIKKLYEPYQSNSSIYRI